MAGGWYLLIGGWIGEMVGFVVCSWIAAGAHADEERARDEVILQLREDVQALRAYKHKREVEDSQYDELMASIEEASRRGREAQRG